MGGSSGLPDFGFSLPTRQTRAYLEAPPFLSADVSSSPLCFPKSNNDADRQSLLVGVVTKLLLDLLGIMFRTGVLIQLLKHILDSLRVSCLCLLRQLIGSLVVAIDGLLQCVLSEFTGFIVFPVVSRRHSSPWRRIGTP